MTNAARMNLANDIAHSTATLVRANLRFVKRHFQRFPNDAANNEQTLFGLGFEVNRCRYGEFGALLKCFYFGLGVFASQLNK